MNISLRMTAALLATVSLAACGQQQEAQVAEATPAAQPSAEAAPGSAPAAKAATGSGTVTAVDATAGTITIDHGAIPEVGWPAMSMAFKANPPALASQVRAGDKISFDVEIKDGAAAEVTAVRSQ